VINCLGAVLIALAVIMPALMLLRCRLLRIATTSLADSHSSGRLDDESERLWTDSLYSSLITHKHSYNHFILHHHRLSRQYAPAYQLSFSPPTLSFLSFSIRFYNWQLSKTKKFPFSPLDLSAYIGLYINTYKTTFVAFLRLLFSHRTVHKQSTKHLPNDECVSQWIVLFSLSLSLNF
jgi:hypothetical protein